MKNFFITILSWFFVMGSLFTPVAWSVNSVDSIDNVGVIDIFTLPTCHYCHSAKDYLENLQQQLQEEENITFTINDYHIGQYADKVQRYYEEYNVRQSQQWRVPAIFLWENFFLWFNENIAKQIKNYFIELKPIQEISPDPESNHDIESENQETSNTEESNIEESITEISSDPESNHDIESENQEISLMESIPFLWEVDVLSFSLPILAITLGIIDGFNVCSLSALIMILWLVMVFKSRKKIILLGGTFLLTTAVMYGILIFIWHQFFSYISPFINHMSVVIGFLALIWGIYLLKEFYSAYKHGPICSSNNLMSRLAPKMNRAFQNTTNWWALVGVVFIFAIVITIIEFPCSAFLPAIFTGILVDAGIPFYTSLWYMLLYMLMYLSAEIIIFTIAVVTLQIKIISPKFIIFFNLLAALIFIWIWLYYLISYGLPLLV